MNWLFLLLAIPASLAAALLFIRALRALMEDQP